MDAWRVMGPGTPFKCVSSISEAQTNLKASDKNITAKTHNYFYFDTNYLKYGVVVSINFQHCSPVTVQINTKKCVAYF